jgi:retron-type reverse transcriptase
MFIADSYSCRNNKGMHKAINRFRKFARKTTRNNTKTVWALKGDIRKFFANIDHSTLKKVLGKYICDKNIIWLLGEIIDSFCTANTPQVGLPLGNLTSQLFVNIYMNEFDQFVKHKFKVKYYIRYADDFVIFGESKAYLEDLIPKISDFLEKHLKLTLHPDKLFIKTLTSGIDFLGWVHFPNHRVLRTSTKRRMYKNLKRSPTKESVASYLGILNHGNTYKLKRKVWGDAEAYLHRS